MPVDHLLLPEADALPAIVVTRLPSGLVHFVVVWRVHGRLVQVMDPARGRRWVRRETFLRDVYLHRMSVPADAFREFAASEAFTGPLAHRLRALGASDGEALIAGALDDAGWSAIAALDGAARTVAALVASGAVSRGAEAAAWSLRWPPLQPRSDGAPPVPPLYATASAAPAAEDGTAQVAIRGAVLLRVSSAAPLDDAQKAALARRAARRRRRAAAARRGRALAPPGPRWARALGRARRRGRAGGAGRRRRSAAVPGAHRSRGGRVAPAARDSWRALAGRPSAARRPVPGRSRGRSCCCWWRCSRSSSRWRGACAARGRGSRSGCARSTCARSRACPTATSRAGRSRTWPSARTSCTDCARCRRWAERSLAPRSRSWSSQPRWPGSTPRGARAGVALGLVALLVPFVAEPAVAERDLRMRNHAGALGRFYLDGLLGLVAVRTHGAEPALAREHRDCLREWVAAARRALGAALTRGGRADAARPRAGRAAAGGFFARGATTGAARDLDPGTALLLVYWALSLPALGQELTALVQQIPAQRNLTLRLLEPLGAPEDDAAGAARATQATQRSRARPRTPRRA